MTEPITFFEDRRNASGISVKLDLLHEDVSDMKAVLKELTAAISRLAVVESDQGHIRAAQERSFAVLAKLEERITTLEQLAVTSKQTNTWMEKGLWAAAAAVAMYVAKKIGLITYE